MQVMLNQAWIDVELLETHSICLYNFMIALSIF